ncbi:MAG: peptidyl-prolyl cis-trans isomerase [Desulfobacterales bacterium]|nr:MAG: peptidyl-prolyl cis-trans isomerase [Desulfobacterales bacterium]
MSDNKPDRKSNRIKTWMGEPLVHFLAIGALIFVAFHLWGGGPNSSRIVITPGQIDSMAARFTRTWQRSPTEEEMKGLIDDHVRNEIAAREAMAMGLDRDDTIIQRRLRQKLEFLAEDAVDAAPPTDDELRAWLNEHADEFRIEPEIGFFQVYLNPDKRGNSIQDDTKKILEQLRKAGPPVDKSVAGDSLMLPNELDLTRLSNVTRIFGRQFADEIIKVEPGRWTGPVSSGYGIHLVYVTERQEGRIPAFAEVRQAVEREFLAARRKEALSTMYKGMLERYHVTIEQRANEEGTASAATEPVKGDSL